MASVTGIEWTDSSWNPIVGCSIVSKGCTNCYAMKVAGARTKHTAKYQGLTQPSKAGPVWTGEVRFWKKALLDPLKWRTPRRVFVNSMGDLFHEDIPDEWIDRCFAVMALAPQHTFQILTKRPERMRAYMLEKWQGTPAQSFAGIDIAAEGKTGRQSQIEEACQPLLDQLGLVNTEDDDLWTEDGKCKAMQWTWPLPNVWLGTSCEDQTTADERIPQLLQTPAAIRFVSAEPMLESIDLSALPMPTDPRSSDQNVIDALSGFETRSGAGTYDRHQKLDWVIVGGESGSEARPMHPDWARSLRDQCLAAGTAFFFKQWGAFQEGSDFKPGAKVVMNDGRTCEFGSAALVDMDRDKPVPPTHPTLMLDVGKKSAGRLLDGREWNEFPEARR